jgi:environmental stress-induced protein Ves
VLTQTQDAQLGYALDSRYYGTKDFNAYMRESLAKLTLEDVNRAIRKHLKSDALQIVMVTKTPKLCATQSQAISLRRSLTIRRSRRKSPTKTR